MKFYSELNGLMYDTAEELQTAETKIIEQRKKKEKEKQEEKRRKEERNKEIARDIASIISCVEKYSAINNQLNKNMDNFFKKYKTDKDAQTALSTALSQFPDYNILLSFVNNKVLDDILFYFK